MHFGTAAAVGIVLLAMVVSIGVFNRLVTFRNRYRNAYAQIDVQLKRRYDLIPNLVETARGYLKHERETLEHVVAARSAAVSASGAAAANPGDPSAMRGLSSAETALSSTIARLLAVVERYPDLKASATMSQLMEELTSTENRIAFARQAYNDAVAAYNIARERFPNFLIAATCGFGAADLFEIASEVQRQAPTVQFGGRKADPA